MQKKQRQKENKEVFINLVSENLNGASSLDEVLCFLLDKSIIPKSLMERYIVIERYKIEKAKGHTKHKAIEKAANYANLPYSTAFNMVKNHLNFFSEQKT